MNSLARDGEVAADSGDEFSTRLRVGQKVLHSGASRDTSALIAAS